MVPAEQESKPPICCLSIFQCLKGHGNNQWLGWGGWGRGVRGKSLRYNFYILMEIQHSVEMTLGKTWKDYFSFWYWSALICVSGSLINLSFLSFANGHFLESSHLYKSAFFKEATGLSGTLSCLVLTETHGGPNKHLQISLWTGHQSRWHREFSQTGQLMCSSSVCAVVEN